MSDPRPAPPLRRRAAPDAPRVAPMEHWRALGWLLQWLCALFGNPEDVARQHTFTAQAHALCAAWLRSAETMLRRLLLIEAAAYAKQETRPRRSTRAPRARTAYALVADEPEQWRVSFRVFSSPAGGGGVRAADGGGDAARNVSRFARSTSPANGGRKELRGFHSTWPLAERYEALLRAYNEPALYAQRLARRLHATPALAMKFTSPPPAHAPCRDLIDALQPDAERTVRRFHNTS